MRIAPFFPLLLIPFPAFSSALAGEPGVPLSYMDCYCTAHPDGGASSTLPYNCTIGPAGTDPSDLIHVDVTILNVLGNPLQNAMVTATPVALSGATLTWCPGEAPQAGISDLNGEVNFVFDHGSVDPGSTPFPPLRETVDFDVFCDPPGGELPYTLPQCDPLLTVLSYDLLDNDLDVGLPDFAVFAHDLRTDDLRSDFNHDRDSNPDAVGLIDFAMFANHLHGSCP